MKNTQNFIWLPEVYFFKKSKILLETQNHIRKP